MKLNHKGLEAAIDAAVKDAPDGGIELDIGAAITAYIQAVGPEPAVAVKWEQLSEIINAAVKVAIRTGSDFHIDADKLREFACSALVATPPAEQHPDDIAVDRFAASMKEKLKWEREQRNRSGWQAMSAADLSRILYEHLPKGDPVDVANLSMMLHQNGQQIETPPAEPVVEADFDSWWRASKYRQVIYADESQRQIALDAWRAALATKPAVKDDETVVTDAMVKAVFAELKARNAPLPFSDDMRSALSAALAATEGQNG